MGSTLAKIRHHFLSPLSCVACLSVAQYGRVNKRDNNIAFTATFWGRPEQCHFEVLFCTYKVCKESVLFGDAVIVGCILQCSGLAHILYLWIMPGGALGSYKVPKMKSGLAACKEAPWLYTISLVPWICTLI